MRIRISKEKFLCKYTITGSRKIIPALINVGRMKKTISIIVAIDKHLAIGKDNDLLGYIPGDLKRFREITLGHPVIMGRKTYESLPKKPLPGRKNIILTTNKKSLYEGCIVTHSMQEALSYCPDDEECFVIGGGKIYAQFLHLTNKLYLTRIHKTFEGDTFFPEIDFKEWKLLAKEDHEPGEKHDFSFSYETYVRK